MKKDKYHAAISTNYLFNNNIVIVLWREIWHALETRYIDKLLLFSRNHSHYLARRGVNCQIMTMYGIIAYFFLYSRISPGKPTGPCTGVLLPA